MDTPEESLPEFGITRPNEERRDGGVGIVFDPKTQLFAVARQPDGRLELFGGGVDPQEDIQRGILREVTEESGLYDFSHVEVLGAGMAHYRNIQRKVNRITKSTALLIILKSAVLQDLELEPHESHILAWVSSEQLLVNWAASNDEKDHDHSIYFLKKAMQRIGELGYNKTA